MNLTFLSFGISSVRIFQEMLSGVKDVEDGWEIVRELSDERFLV